MADAVSFDSSSSSVVVDPSPPLASAPPPPTATERAMDRALSKSTPTDAQNALKLVRKEKRKTNTDTETVRRGEVSPPLPLSASPGLEAAAAATPAAQEGVIDFANLATEPASTIPAASDEAPPAPTEEELKGLDEAVKKKLNDRDKENAKVRKRAQEAEAARDAAATENTTLKQQLAELEKSPPALAGNAFGHVINPAYLDWVEQDAHAQLRKLQKAALDPDADRTHTFFDAQGQKEDRELTADDLDAATDALAQVQQRRTQMAAHQKSETAAQPIVKFASEHVPEFKAAHATLRKRDPGALPETAALAALGALVRDGGYSLLKKSSAKAAPAKSGAGEPEGAARTASPERNAPREVATTMPPASRTSEQGTVTIPSAVRARAMKGDQNAVKEMIRLKMQRRQVA